MVRNAQEVGHSPRLASKWYREEKVRVKSYQFPKCAGEIEMFASGMSFNINQSSGPGPVFYTVY